MAKIVQRSTASYPKERDGFLRDLQHFHETRGTPFRRAPILAGKEVDLYLLYTLVTEQGGWIKVNSKNAWTEVLDQMKIPKDCVNGTVAIKQIYLRYLDRWEKVHYLGEEADRGSDDDEESRHKRWSARALHSVPLTYNYGQHSVVEANREYNHLSTNLYKPSDYDRLALSLISPLPNEQDFAINVCTLLSNDNKHTLKLQKHPRLLDYLLAHAGVFCHSSLRRIFIHCYSVARKNPIHRFWEDVLESKEFLDLTNEAKFVTKPPPRKGDVKVEAATQPSTSSSSDLTLESRLSLEQGPEASTSSGGGGGGGGDVVTASSSSSAAAAVSDVCCEQSEPESDCEITNYKKRFKFSSDDSDPCDRELFCLGRTLGTQDYVGQRVLQVATILRNLSFIEENVQVLLQNKTFVRFLLLCVGSRWGHLRNLGMDILGNVALEFLVKDHPDDRLAAVLLKLVANGLKSDDRTACISSLEVLNKLSQNEANEDTLLRHLEMEVYEKVCSFLTIHDVMLLIYTLECLYSLSSLGERSCNLIVNNHGVVDTLVSLVTVEGKSYGPKACIGMKLVETLPGGVSSTTTHVQGATSASGTSPANTTSTSAAATTVSTPAVLTTPAKVISLPSTPARTVQIAPQRLLSISPSPAMPTATPVPVVQAPAATPAPSLASSQTMTPQQIIQQQHAHQQAIHENEQFALAWLRATYEPCANGKVDHQELYKHYLNSCSKIGRRGVISPLHFPRCVRSVFGGTVGPNPMKPANASEPQYYEGIKVMAHPHLSQALLGSGSSSTATGKDNQIGQSNTSLIKSLLATKVAARQQQQRLLAQQTTPQQLPSADPKHKNDTTPKGVSRVNGARQLFTDNDVGDPSVSSTTQFTNMLKGKKEPPQPPPPLAPLSINNKAKSRFDNEDSDSTGNSLASSSGMGTIGIGGISSTEDGDNSLTSFEGLLNGIPNIDNPLNEDSNSKDSVKMEITKNKPLRLADLLEKKVEKNPPTLNGTLGKEMNRNLDLVENHIEKALSERNNAIEDAAAIMTCGGETASRGIKRPAGDDVMDAEAKKPMLNVNGTVSAADSPAPESVASSNGDEGGSTTVSTAAAKLFADIAADILEDEDEEQLLEAAAQSTSEVAAQVTAAAQAAAAAAQPMQQIIMDSNQQMQLRQIIVSQPQMQTNQVFTTSMSATHLKTQTGQTVIVQNSGQGRGPMMLQPNTGQILLSQGLQGQVQLVASTTQPGQYVLQTSGTQGAYVVAQPQTAVVHGQPQTVLVAQTAQQQGSGTKTIIILQQQPATTAATHHQKVVVTPQGQQVVVTQVHRPMLQTSTVTNNILPTTSVIKTAPAAAVSAVITQNTVSTTAGTTTTANGVTTVIKKEPDEVKPKVVRDLTTPFVCEWGDCSVETKFKSANQVYLHVCETHCPKGSEEIICQWERCDNMKRKRFSLMTHIHDKHCNTDVMKQSLTRRKQVSQGGKVEPPPPAPTTPHPGYAPDAALHAIKRHALEFVNPKELQDDNEGPVTKSIRLTASLILRNLVIYSSNCRRYLKHYEPHLANVALSNVESSRTIAQVLYDMNEGSSHR